MDGRWAPDPWGEAELRWHDGTQWTTHVARARTRSTSSPTAPDVAVTRPDTGRPRTTPLWAKVAVPAVALFGIGAAASAIDHSSDHPAASSERPSAPTVIATSTTTTTSTSMAPAVTTTSAVAVETTAAPEVASQAAVPVADPALVQTCIDFTQAAATMSMQKYVDLWNFVHNDPATLAAACGMMAEPDLQVIAQDMQTVQAFFDASNTTAPPPPPPVTAPPATAPPVTAPPAPPPTQPPPVITSPPAPSCDPNYGGCVPIASDVDCAGGSGNGPEYVRGPIPVIGRDVYDLDRDGDGIACN